MKTYVTSFGVAFCIFFTVFYFSASFTTESKIAAKTPEEMLSTPENMKSPPCVELYNCIEKYSEEYQVPRNIAFGVAFSETRYKGPMDWGYDHDKTSGAGALGPMQVMYPTAKGLFPEKEFSREELKSDIDFNVHCSMKLLRKLYNKYNNWKLVLGAYNTGTPCVNGYAEKVYNYHL
jgi:soluble lytic murein transglycosylase-like protein